MGYFLNLEDCVVCEDDRDGVFVRGNILHHDDRGDLKMWALRVLQQEQKQNEEALFSIADRIARTQNKINRIERA